MGQRKRAAVYRRISTSAQENGSSLDVQLKDCTEHIQNKGYDLVADFADVHSGTDLWFRPKVQEVLNAAAQRQFDVLVVHKTDRLARDVEHQAYLRVELDRYGVRVEAVRNQHDRATFAGRLVDSFEQQFAEYEISVIQARMATGLKNRIEIEHRLPGAGHPLFGYQYDNPETGQKNRYVEDPAQSWVVRRIYREAVEGRSLRQISAGLRAEGILTGRGKEWHPRQISRLLAHPTYRGVVAANRYASASGHGGKRSTSSRPESEWIPTPDGAPALVDDATWFRANERLERNMRERTRDYDQATDALLRAGFVYCKWCGGHMSVHRQHSGVYYRCNNAHRDSSMPCRGKCIEATKLDSFVWNLCDSWLADPGVLLHEARRSRPLVEESVVERVSSYDEGLRRIEAEQSNLARMLGQLDEQAASPVLQRLTELGQQRSALMSERETAVQRVEAAKQAERAVESIWTEINAYVERIGEWGYEQKRELLHRLGVRVTVQKRGSGRYRFWVDVNPPWPEDTAWWPNLFGGLPDGPFETANGETVLTDLSKSVYAAYTRTQSLAAEQDRDEG